jgi:hypothetical protein
MMINKASIRADEHDSALLIIQIIPIKIHIPIMTIKSLTFVMMAEYII